MTDRNFSSLHAAHGRRCSGATSRPVLLATILVPVLIAVSVWLWWSGPAGPEAMRQAERLLGEHSAMGNTDQATSAAESIGETMANLRQNFFTGSADGAEPDPFPTHVWLAPDSAVVLVQIPELSRFDPAARKNLAEMAWMSAVLTLMQRDLQADRLTVATRSQSTYDRALSGQPVEGDVATEVERQTVGNRATRKLLAGSYTSEQKELVKRPE